MKAYIALAVLLVGICLIQDTNGWYFYSPWSYLGYGGYGWPYYRYYRDTMSKGDISTRIQCRYTSDKTTLSCSGTSGLVDCESTYNVTGLGTEFKFDMYGLSVDTTVTTGKTEFIRYFMFPRKLDNSMWYNHTITVDKKDVNLAVFHSWTYNKDFYGFRINDFSCYERLVNLFKTATSDEVVSIGNVTPKVTVPLFGEILVGGKQV